MPVEYGPIRRSTLLCVDPHCTCVQDTNTWQTHLDADNSSSSSSDDDDDAEGDADADDCGIGNDGDAYNNDDSDLNDGDVLGNRGGGRSSQDDADAADDDDDDDDDERGRKARRPRKGCKSRPQRGAGVDVDAGADARLSGAAAAGGGRAEARQCAVCAEQIEGLEWVSCRQPACPSSRKRGAGEQLQRAASREGCDMLAHVECLGEYMLDNQDEGNRCIPVQGECPHCRRLLLWGQLIRGSQLR